MNLWGRIKGAFRGRSSTALVKTSSTSSAEVAINNPPVLPRHAREQRWLYSVGAATQTSMTASLWVYCCASLIANAVASVPLKVMKGKRELRRHPLIDLLKRPHPESRFRHWQAERAYHLVLTGTDYIHIRRASVHGESLRYPGVNKPAQLWTYPEGEFRTKVESSGAPRVIGYERCTGGHLDVTERDVIRTMFVRPGREGAKRGLSPLEAASREASMDDAAANWQRNSFANRCRPDGAFELQTPPGMTLRPEQLNEARKHLREAWMGSMNARAPMTYGNAKWIQMAMNAVESDYRGTRQDSGKAICAAFNVPDVFFKASDTKFANMPEARFLLWDSNIIPTAELLNEGINDELALEYGGDIRVELDLTKVHALNYLLKMRWDIADRELDRGVPMEQVSRRHNLGVEPYPGWDQPTTPQANGAPAPEPEGAS